MPDDFIAVSSLRFAIMPTLNTEDISIDMGSPILMYQGMELR